MMMVVNMCARVFVWGGGRWGFLGYFGGGVVVKAGRVGGGGGFMRRGGFENKGEAANGGQLMGENG